MCTTSIVRFRFSFKDNLTNSETLNNSIRSSEKYLRNYSSTGISISGKRRNRNKFITQNTINMNKGLSNGHEFSLNDIDIDINANNNISTTTLTTTPTTTSTDTTMGLLNSNSKDNLNLTQHLITSLKTGKPENGQRIDFTNIQWNDLKQTNTNTTSHDINDIKTNNCVSNQLEINNLAPISPSLNDQSVEQLIQQELQQNVSQEQQQIEKPKMESNIVPEEEQQQRESLGSEVANELNDNNIAMCPSTDPQSEPIDIKAQQLLLEKQSDRLMRRIRRLQFKQTHRHLTKQMRAFVDHQQIVTGISCQRQTESNANIISQLQSVVNPVEDRMKLLTPEGVKGLSTSALVNLVKRLGSTATHEINRLNEFCPQQTSFQLPPQTPSFTTTSSSSTQLQQTPQLIPNSTEETTLVKLLQKSHTSSSVSQQSRVNSDEKESFLNTVDTLNANLRNFERGFDSDATESSSGGESCDEFEDYNQDPIQHSTPIHSSGHLIPMKKRSCWKWCVERGAIASRWTWLQAQVADLEFRIRQQNEMYRQLRATKGHISYGVGDHSLTVPNSSLISKVNTLSIGNSGVNSNLSQSQQSAVNSESNSHYCMRTLPLNSMRKRKLVRSMNALSGATRKAAKYSTVQCACNGLPDIVSPCVLCNGRYSYVHVIDTDCMPHFERVALLDSSCHPVLSLRNDVSLGLHFSELLKRETIQRPIPSRQQNKKRKSPPSPTLANKFLFDNKNKSPKRSQSVISSTKLRKKYDGTTKRKYVRRSGPSDGVWRKRGRPRERVSSGSSRTESPIPSPVPSDGSCCGNSLSAPLHRRRRSEQHAFDINNIVIPYSIAATTRVEKLQYKEIITPKWRTNEPSEESSRFFETDIKTDMKTELSPDIKPNASQLLCAGDENEEISDTAFALRHAKCEEEERKRILAFMKGSTKQTGAHLRGRGARVRFDSTRSDTLNSNANSCGGDGVLQNIDSTSQDSYNGNSAAVVQNINNDSVSNTIAEIPSDRRRSVSVVSKREDSIDDNYESVNPFDLRTFPLNDIEFELMIKESTHLYSCEENIDLSGDPEKSNEGTITANNSRAPSPINSEVAESIADHIEDIDNEDEDPEWEPKK